MHTPFPFVDYPYLCYHWEWFFSRKSFNYKTYMDQLEEIYFWLVHNVGPRNYRLIASDTNDSNYVIALFNYKTKNWRNYSKVISFRYEEDLLAFKLRFGIGKVETINNG